MTKNIQKKENFKKELEETRILENKQKDKVEKMRKEMEALTSLEEKQKAKIEKIKKPIKHKIAKNIGKVALVGALTTAAILGVNEMRKSRQKDQVQREDDKKNTDPNQKIDSTATFPTKTIITPDSLRKSIAKEQIAPMISYEKIADIVNAISKEYIREELINFLKAGKITEAQEMFGMKRDSKYAANKATGKIDFNTLQRF